VFEGVIISDGRVIIPDMPGIGVRRVL